MNREILPALEGSDPASLAPATPPEKTALAGYPVAF